MCTYENDPQLLKCAICLSARAAAGSASSRSPAVATKAVALFRTPKKSMARPAVGHEVPQSLLVSVGSSVEKEAARLRKKVEQMRELGIDLPPNDVVALLARNCYSVQVAACEYFEKMAAAERVATGGGSTCDAEGERRLSSVVEQLEMAFEMEPCLRVLGRMAMAATLNRSGVKLRVGDQLLLQAENAGKKRLRVGMSAASAVSGGIVRIATMQHSQRSLELLLHPLMKSGLVRLGGVCEAPPASSQMFASFDVRFLLALFPWRLYECALTTVVCCLRMVRTAEAPAEAAQSLRGAAETAGDAPSEVNPEDLDTLFSECVGANDLQEAANHLDSDPSEQLVPWLHAIELRDHQKQALRWMLWRENQLRNGEARDKEADNPERHFHSKGSYFVNPFEKTACLTRPEPPAPCLGGILADDMGMGAFTVFLLLTSPCKTMMLLSLIAHQKHFGAATVDDGDASPTQPKRLATAKTLVVCPLSLLHQWKNEVEERFLPNTLKVHVHYGDDRDVECVSAMGSFRKSDVVLTTYGVLAAEADKGGLLLATDWTRVILDEAHSIKNRLTGYFKACSTLRATHRWCLTGTPIQNSLEDLFSLLCFLQYQPWSRVAWWKRVIAKPYEDGDDADALGRLKLILAPVLLRRTKHSRDKQGRRIVQLPPKRVDLVRLEFSADERAFYQAVFDKSRAEFNGFVASGSAMSSYVAIFALLLRLRQACDHPLLALGKDLEQVRQRDADGGQADATKPTRSAFQPQEDESMDAYYRRISTRLQQDMQASSRTQLPGVDSDLGSSSTGGLTASYIQSVIAQVEDGLESQECPICLDPPQKAVLTPCAHVLCGDCLRESLANDPESGCPVCRAVVDMDKVFALPPAASPKAESESSDTSSAAAGDQAETATADAAEDDGTGFQSAKLRQLLRDLKSIRLENDRAASPAQRRKVVVFSQWTAMLEMASRLLSRHGFSHCTFNGSMSQEARERVLTRFAKSPGVEVLVISLKAGGVGLNLTCASVVILLDPWWNPGVEEQAVDRVHRLGQTQDVLVRRYVVSDTVEDMMLQLQRRKERLAKHVLLARPHDERRGERLNLDDLKSFFRR
ncbi:hypothetical protein BBJ28_00007902 [Nothophytophthora sp. Chile5]|nr:hypothetical protein BBJ28_00007902 [Nothophytophthora sp. Chile5]